MKSVDPLTTLIPLSFDRNAFTTIFRVSLHLNAGDEVFVYGTCKVAHPTSNELPIEVTCRITGHDPDNIFAFQCPWLCDGNLPWSRHYMACYTHDTFDITKTGTHRWEFDVRGVPSSNSQTWQSNPLKVDVPNPPQGVLGVRILSQNAQQPEQKLYRGYLQEVTQ